MEKLAREEVEARLTEFPKWALSGEKLQRTFKLDDFAAAMAFVNRVAELAERQAHHPDIMIRLNKVMLTLTTHDAGGLTDGDFVLAAGVGLIWEEAREGRAAGTARSAPGSKK